MAIIGINSDVTPDQLAIVALADILSGETIYISDLEWLGSAWDTPSTTDGAITWNTTSSISAGTILNITISSSGITGDLSTYGTVTTYNWTSTNSAVTSGGDAWFIYQGAAPNAVPSNWVFGWNNWSTSSHAWVTTGSTSATTSKLHADLTNGTDAIALSNTVANGGNQRDNMFYTGTTNGDKTTVLATITNTSNWTGDETTIQDLNSGGTNFPATFTGLSAPDVTVGLSVNNDVTCPGGTDGSITASVTTGTSNYTYSWSNGSTISNTSSTIITISNSPACTNTSHPPSTEFFSITPK